MKILLGIVGQYRTFEKTYQNIYEMLIDNNPEHSFDIIINTDFNNKNISTTNKKNLNIINYSKEELIKRLNFCYGKNLIDVINYEHLDENTGATMLFRKRISIICNDLNNNYDLYIFLRFDIILKNKINIEKYYNNSFNFICGDKTNNNRKDHNRDWDFCIIFNKVEYFNYFNFYKNSKYISIEDINMVELIKFLKKANLKSKYIDLINTENIDSWVKNFWCNLYNMSLNGCAINFDNENFTSLVR